MQTTSPFIITLKGHTERVSSLIELPNGILASASVDATIKLWNISNSSLIRTLQETSSVFALAVLNDGKLASGSYKEIKLWDPNNGLLIRRLLNHTDFVTSLKALDNQTMASASDDKTIKIWNTINGILLKTLTGQTCNIEALTLLPNSLLASSCDSTIKLWNIGTGSLIKTLIGHTDVVFSLAVLKDGTLVSGSNDQTIKLWNTNNGTQIRTLINSKIVQSLAVFKDERLASSSFNLVNIWSSNDRSLVKTISGDWYNILSLAALNDGSLAIGSFNRDISIVTYKG